MSKDQLPHISQIPDDGQYHVFPCDPMRQHIIIRPVNPEGVLKVIGGGNSCRVGLLRDGTALKYALVEADRMLLEVEAQIFSALGHHDRLIKYLGKKNEGLNLELVKNGSVKDYMSKIAAYQIPLILRLKWARQTAEALTFVHLRGVIHCDLCTANLLLDDGLDIKLSDLQGTFKDLDGLAMESVRSFLPRETSIPQL